MWADCDISPNLRRCPPPSPSELLQTPQTPKQRREARPTRARCPHHAATCSQTLNGIVQWVATGEYVACDCLEHTLSLVFYEEAACLPFLPVFPVNSCLRPSWNIGLKPDSRARARNIPNDPPPFSQSLIIDDHPCRISTSIPPLITCQQPDTLSLTKQEAAWRS
jgi:hypothetical protein